MSEIKTIQLKNGSVEPMPVVMTTMISLEALVKTKPIEFYELVMKCRNTDHSYYGNSQAVLQALSLIDQNGTPFNSVRNVVLSAVTGDGMNLTLDNPN